MGNDTDRGSEWFEALYSAHRASVVRYAWRRVGDDAEDVVAEVFASAWTRRHDADVTLVWLYRTAWHHIQHGQRGFARRATLLEKAQGSSPALCEDHADDVAAALDSAALVRRGMQLLPPAETEILRLWAWEQLDGPEIAEVLGCSAAAARVRLHRAKKRLKNLLGEDSPIAIPRQLTARTPSLPEAAR